MDKVIVSIIIPCWNTKKEDILRAVKSVDEQVFNDYEVLIVDDGSLNEYHSVLADIVSQHENYVLVTLKNGGVSNARNVGALSARGKYIAYLDSDDAIDKNFLLEAVSLAEKESADFVIGGIYKNGNGGKSNYLLKERYKVFSDNDIQNLKKYLISCDTYIELPMGYIGRGPVARLVRNDIMKNNMFPKDVAIGEDLLWNLQVLSKCKNVVVSSKCWYWYFDNQQSATHKFNPKIYDIWTQQLKILYKDIIDDDKLYTVYVEHVFEGMCQIYKNFLAFKKYDYKKVISKLYSEQPWTIFGSNKSLYSLKSLKYRIYIIFYKLHILFFAFFIKDKILKLSKEYKIFA